MTIEYIESRILEMRNFIEQPYTADSIDDLLNRVQFSVAYQSECVLLLQDAQNIRGEKELGFINEKERIRKLHCYKEYALVEAVDNVRMTLGRVSSTTQSQMAVWKADKITTAMNDKNIT